MIDKITNIKATPPAAKPHILIVDDEPANIRMLSAGLRDEYDIAVATDGHEAIELIKKQPGDIDLVLLDVMMPGLSGYVVCATLKRLPETKHIPIIFLTARDRDESEEKGLELGAVDYITKPFSLPVVKARVRTHVALKQHHDLLLKLLNEQSSKLQRYETEYQRLFENVLAKRNK